MGEEGGERERGRVLGREGGSGEGGRDGGTRAKPGNQLI